MRHLREAQPPGRWLLVSQNVVGCRGFPDALENWWVKQNSNLAHFNICQIFSCFVPIRNTLRHSQIIVCVWFLFCFKSVPTPRYRFAPRPSVASIDHPTPGQVGPPSMSVAFSPFVFPHCSSRRCIDSRGNSFFKICDSTFTPRSSLSLQRIFVGTSTNFSSEILILGEAQRQSTPPPICRLT